VVKVNGQQVVVSAKDGPVSLKITPGLKLTEISASIDKLESRQDYTPANDPYAKFTRATDLAPSDSAQSQFAANYATALVIHYDALTGAGVEAGNINSMPATNDSSSNADRSLASVSQYAQGANIAAGASPGLVVKTGGNPDIENYDALDLSFDVSTPKALNSPYVVIVCRYHERNTPPGVVRNWIYAKAIDRIDFKPRRVHFLAGGFTPGFQVKSLEVHLYDNGNEVATNLSSKRVPLTRDEAFEYVKMDYVSSHKGATLPAAPAMGNLPGDLPSRLAQGQFKQAFYVKVSKEGIGEGAFLDKTCSRRVEDPYVESMFKGIRFKPALQNGLPVDGVAMVKLDQLMM